MTQRQMRYSTPPQVQQAPQRPAETTTAAFWLEAHRSQIESLSIAVPSTFLPTSYIPPRNPFGKPVKPRKGGKGMSGLRADLRDGVLTLREAAMMPVSELSSRYKVKRSSARGMRKAILLHGAGSRMCDALGRPRSSTDDPSAAPQPKSKA